MPTHFWKVISVLILKTFHLSLIIIEILLNNLVFSNRIFKFWNFCCWIEHFFHISHFNPNEECYSHENSMIKQIRLSNALHNSWNRQTIIIINENHSSKYLLCIPFQCTFRIKYSIGETITFFIWEMAFLIK